MDKYPRLCDTARSPGQWALELCHHIATPCMGITISSSHRCCWRTSVKAIQCRALQTFSITVENTHDIHSMKKYGAPDHEGFS